jgi:hypothetical protein
MVECLGKVRRDDGADEEKTFAMTCTPLFLG